MFQDWQFVCLGDVGSSILGRIPMALRVAGATYINGLSEAEVMMRCGIEYLNGKGLRTDTLRRISIIENDSTNTSTSMEAAVRLIRQRYGSNNLTCHLVTSANHAPRLARDAVVAFADLPNVIIGVVPAHTSYGHKCPSDVIIRDLSF
jgi:hypothetical protein